MNNAVINKILISSFISHGFLDYIVLFPHICKNLSLYITSISGFFLLFTIEPSMSICIFVGLSMYHFGEDFNYLLNRDNGNNWAGVTLFSSTTILDRSIWINTLNWLNVINSEFMVNTILFLTIPTFMYNYDKLFVIIPSFIIGLGGVKYLSLYGCLIHSPVAVYRFVKSGKTLFIKILYILIWILGTGILYYILPMIKDFINVTSVNFMFSLLNSHILTITYWQMKNKDIGINNDNNNNYKKIDNNVDPEIPDVDIPDK